MQLHHWVKNFSELVIIPPEKIQEWLLKPYIISKALKQCCKKLTVQVLSQEFSMAYPSEVHCLGIVTNTAELPLVRRVYLEGDGMPWTYGRVIVPFATYRHNVDTFQSLHENLIGEKLLFNNPAVVRDSFEYICLDNTAKLYKEMMVSLPYMYHVKYVWGRRSVFFVKKMPLMVSEYFLATIPKYPHCGIKPVIS